MFLVELDAEHPQRVPGAEQGGVPAPQVKLKERQKFFEEAFQQDMEQYLSTGYLQIAERRGENDLFRDLVPCLVRDIVTAWNLTFIVHQEEKKHLDE